MCTATWLKRAGGYELFFNRDESRTRLRADPPQVLSVEGVRVLAPRDGEAGGTWLAVNEHGVTLALLNAHTNREPEGPVSRGTLVRTLAAAPDADAIGARLTTSMLASFRGFRLLAVGPGPVELDVALWSWDGRELLPEEPRLPLASSSLGSREAHEARAGALRRLAEPAGLDVAVLERFHASHDPERGPWSPCVHRDDVVTLSACHVRVDEAEVQVRYADGSPCVAGFGPPAVLARRAARTS